jgi:hypothetical protein
MDLRTPVKPHQAAQAWREMASECVTDEAREALLEDPVWMAKQREGKPDEQPGQAVPLFNWTKCPLWVESRHSAKCPDWGESEHYANVRNGRHPPATLFERSINLLVTSTVPKRTRCFRWRDQEAVRPGASLRRAAYCRASYLAALRWRPVSIV